MDKMNIPDFHNINPKGISKKSFLKKYPEFYRYLQQTYPQLSKLSEQCYWYIHNLKEHPICKVCGRPTSYRGFNKGYSTYCSYSCINKDKDIQKKSKAVRLERYGNENFNNRKKFKETNIKKYGIDNIFRDKEYIKNKFKDKYGVDYPSQVPSIIQKRKDNFRRKYGVDNQFQLKETQDKSKQTKQERYGNPNFNNPKKRKQTCLEMYGVDNPMYYKYIKEKNINSRKNKYINIKDCLVGYTANGDWICKCPHSDTCDQCREKFYISNSDIYNSRLKYKCELCTNLFPIGSWHAGKSNSSQLYFDQLNKYFPDSIYYKKSGYEYKTGRYNLDFYIPSLKIDIEYNGVYWHMKPSLYKSTDINHINNKTAQEIWNRDEIRKEYIESQGIKVIIVWEDELPDPEELYKYIKIGILK